MKTAGVITTVLLMMFAMTSVAARCKKFRRQIKSLTKEKENLVKEVEILQSQLKESESGRCDVNAQCICKAGFSGDGKTCTKLIDGGYSKWSSWSQCSTTCGDGLRSRSRSCTNPPPNAEGKDCAELGPDKETEECNNGNCPGCPAGWVTNGVSCYYLDPTRTKKMSDARQKCQSLGAHLPIIRSANERDFIFDMLKKHQSLTNEGVWLGLERRAGSSFYWVDGTPLNYQTWGSGEPNNYGGNENCAQMYKGGGNAGKWNDNPCDSGAAPGVLCQKPI